MIERRDTCHHRTTDGRRHRPLAAAPSQGRPRLAVRRARRKRARRTWSRDDVWRRRVRIGALNHSSDGNHDEPTLRCHDARARRTWGSPRRAAFSAPVAAAPPPTPPPTPARLRSVPPHTKKHGRCWVSLHNTPVTHACDTHHWRCWFQLHNTPVTHACDTRHWRCWGFDSTRL